MTKSERKLVRTTGIMGVLLTLFVVVLDQAGILLPLEHLLYDYRATYCQLNVPASTDTLCHVDIDDAACENLGRWPWPRNKLANIVDELHAAGAKVIAFDVIFTDKDSSEASDASMGVSAGPAAGDKAFSESLRSFGRVLLPFSFPSKPLPRDPIRDALVTALSTDLEAKRVEDVLPKVQRNALKDVPIEAFRSRFVEAREAAMMSRLLEPQFEGKTLEQIRDVLLPNSRGLGGSPALHVLAKQHELAERLLILQSKGRAVARGLPPILPAASAQPPTVPLARAAAYTGFVTYLPTDGVVRTVPLWVRYGDKLYPQIGFSLACAMLGVDVNNPSQVRITPDQVTIYPPGEEAVIIPVTIQPSAFGPITIIDIPWVGKGWEGLYGKDEAGKPKRHISVNLIWDIREKRQSIITNNANADDAIRDLLGYDVGALNDYNAHLPAPADALTRNKLMDHLLVDQKDDIEEWRHLSPADRNALDKNKRLQIDKAVASYDSLPRIRQQNVQLAKELSALTEQLRIAVGGKAVLFGSISTAASDFVVTSVGPEFPGVVAHSTVYNAIMTRRLLSEVPAIVGLMLTILFGLLTVVIVTYFSPWPAIASTFLIAAGYLLLNGLVLYDRHHVIVPAAGPLSAIAIVWSGSNLFRYIVERAEKKRITRRLGSYMDPGLLEYVIAHPEKARLEGEQKELTIVFTDLKGFTTLAEKLGEGAVRVLGEYLGEMVPCVRFTRGYVNKFIGDGIMCLFGALAEDREHAANAVAAVIEMNKALDRFNLRLAERGLPSLEMRAGINSGVVSVGDAGPNERTDFTALGDPVNFAARLESANKVVGCHILIGGRTAELLNGRYLLRPVGKLRVVGKSETVMTYEPLALTAHASEAQKNVVRCTAQIVEQFQAGRFAECLQSIRQAEAEIGSNPLFDLYRELCHRYQLECPADFVGQIVLEVK